MLFRSLWEVGATLPAYGVTAFVPTVITSHPDARKAALAAFAAGPPDGWTGSVPLGVHFEGPMISAARKGAHPEQWLDDPTPKLIDGWTRDAGVLMVTIAPELDGALDVIATLAARGVVVAVGHTDASAEQVSAAVDAGARCLTHFGNAMRSLTAREPGPIGVALSRSDLVAGVISDGHHLHPLTLNLAWRALGPHRFLTVSDTTAALGLPDGTARLGDQQVLVANGTVRLEDGTLAGSAASLDACLRVLIEATACSPAEAVATVTTTPALLIGDTSRGRLAPGCRGDLVLVDEELTVVTTIVGGVVVHEGSR